MTLRQKTNGAHKSTFPLPPVPVSDRDALDELIFHRMISVERKRTERSGKPFLLVLIDTGGEWRDVRVLEDLVSTLIRTTRGTNVLGWYKTDSVFGVIFTEIAHEERSTILSTMRVRVSETLCRQLPPISSTRSASRFICFLKSGMSPVRSGRPIRPFIPTW